MAVSRGRHGPNLPSFPAEINIYSARSDAKDIGHILSKFGIFLQYPRYGHTDFEYINPHFLQIEGYSETTPIETSASVGDVAENQDSSVEETTRANDSETVDTILDSLSYHVHQQAISVIPDIKSALLPHQREAIDFIFRRETCQVPSGRSLWKYNDTDVEKPFYQHVFTGEKRPEQIEAKGGIIADEMGLGKSLVILSTVASSRDRASSFVAAESQPIISESSKKTPSGATLIITPSSLLIDNWVKEIRKHAYPGTLPFHTHLGSSRHAETNLLRERLVVFTTYATVAAEFRRGDTTLQKINWFRIVLDEGTEIFIILHKDNLIKDNLVSAHDIRNCSTKQYKAVTSLSAQHRWCLTGTPIQNSLEDLAALVSFLKVPVLEKTQTFRKFITNPINSTSNRRFQNLQTLLQSICLRRTRQLLDLPEPKSEIRKLPFTPYEQAEYDKLILQGRKEIDMAVSGHRKNKTHSAVLESLLKLRLFCNHGSSSAVLLPGPTGLPEDPDEALTFLQQCNENTCCHCDGIIYSISNAADADGGIFMPSCRHLVCRSCMPHHRPQKKRCPACAAGNEPTSLATCILEPNKVQLPPNRRLGNNDALELGQYPTKLLELLSDVRQSVNHKSIIFSSWKKTLSLVGQLLKNHGIRYAMIDGSLPLTERSKVLNDFQSLTGINILLMTLGTGAVGLNLAVASRIYLLEPQWNPSIESQAIGRAFRLGQKAQVVIIQYVMMNSVEESNVLSRQRKKLELAGGGFSKGKNMSSERFQELLVR
ncbi:SNF2 family N-terminal domain-containing protein [Trichoderma sp. TUCIM 5745]